MKSSYLILFVATFIFAQNPETNLIKDYFIPSNGNNKSVYFSPNAETGNRSGISTTKWFILNSDGTYEVISAGFVNGKTTSILSKFIKITDDEIKVYKTVSTTMFETNKKRMYYSERVFLKLPKGKTKTSWEYTDQKEETYICFSEWVGVNVKGQNKKAIKVTRQVKDIDWTKTIEYYVQGIGLWKITFKDGKDFKVLDYQEYDSDVSKLNKR